MIEHMAKQFMYDAMRRNGKRAIMSVYADNIEEAQETALWLCRFIGAEYLGNMTEHRACLI